MRLTGLRAVRRRKPTLRGRRRRADAAARRITELELKATELLGSEKAPVRLRGLYALERLTQDNESQRQTINNVFCAPIWSIPVELPAAVLKP